MSLGLRSLSERGMLQAQAGGWLLARTSLEQFAEPEPIGCTG